MKLKIIISIIVPVYNTEKYLPKCIDSILSQTFSDFECILVDDGSTDNSPLICDEYSKKDNRIVVIHQRNKGVSAARNAGLKNAKGEYVCFVDSDDWIERDYCSVMFNKMNDADLVICGIYIKSNKTKEMKITKKDIVYEKKQFFYEYRKIRNKKYYDIILTSPFNKMYKIDIIKNYNLYFDESFSFGEDYIFNQNYFLFCNKIKMIYNTMYTYINNNTSLSKMNDVKRIEDCYKVIEFTEKYYLMINNNKIIKFKYTSYYHIIMICIKDYKPENNILGKNSILIKNNIKVNLLLKEIKNIKIIIILLLVKLNIINCFIPILKIFVK